MAELWPSTLPQCFLANSVQWAIGEGRLRTPMEAGPAKQRRRTSAVSDALTGQMRMTRQQWSDFMHFVDVTVQGGIDAFTFPNPDAPGQTLLVRIGDSMPSGQRVGGQYVVSVQLEVLPP